MPAMRIVLLLVGTALLSAGAGGGNDCVRTALFGCLAPEEFNRRLADSRGIYADSAIYGRGLLDLDAATSPIGFASVALGDSVNGPGAALQAQTCFGLGSAFGNGLVLSLAGQEIAAFGKLGAPFCYGPDGFVHAASRTFAPTWLDAFMAQPDAGPGSGVTASVPPLLGGFAPPDRGAGWNGNPMGYLDTPATGVAGGHLALASRALAFDAERPGGLGFTLFSTVGMRGRAPVSGALLSWRPVDTSAVPPTRWRAERMGLLGSRATGAFGRISAGAAIVGIDRSGEAGAWRYDAGAEFGMARASASNCMLTGLSPLFSSAFAVRAEPSLGEDSALQFSVSQPLRIGSGRARLSIPVGRTKDGRELRRSFSAGLAPTVRSIWLPDDRCT